jgi:ABC-type sulfate transport system permease subunit
MAIPTSGARVMNNAVDRAVPGRMVKLLAVLSVAFFWLLPFSPMVAIGAVSMTRGAKDWSRNVAVAGAVLCIAYTVLVALLMVHLTLRIGI